MTTVTSISLGALKIYFDAQRQRLIQREVDGSICSALERGPQDAEGAIRDLILLAEQVKRAPRLSPIRSHRHLEEISRALQTLEQHQIEAAQVRRLSFSPCYTRSTEIQIAK